MSSDVHVFLQLQMRDLLKEAEAKKNEAEVSGAARYQESLISLLGYLGNFVKPGQFCVKEHWIEIETRIVEVAQLEASGARADVTDILKMLSARA
jgi:hypothetical protein